MDELKMQAESKLAEEVLNDFLNRQEERRFLERGWQLNMNFVCGNQYFDIDSSGEIYEESKKFYWQNRRVFNHIATTVETRCSKLGRIRPALSVRAASEEESDRHSASLASAILSAVAGDCDLDGVISDATVWSETCGTAFYKIIWDGRSGCAVGVTDDGQKLTEGGVKVAAVPPFEIYPFSLSEQSLSAQPSIIHAQALPVRDIYTAYGVQLDGADIEDIAYSRRDMRASKAVKHGYGLLIERYERPTEDRPCGRLTVVAGGKVLYDGELPYINGDGGERAYPFVKQTALPLAGSFFGTSVVDRLIPLQRAYNAVKNRKHEFLNRISMGTVAVEDGSVDTDELAEDGLMPGKIIVYRQGAKPPEMLTLGSVPAEFGEEEKNILADFAKVSGTGELTDNADSFAGITSATGLQLIIEQDESRMEYAYQQIKRALKDIGRQILRLYRQFATDVRLLKYAGGNNALSIIYFKGSDISSDDVVLDADSESNLSPAQRRTVVYDMLDRGLFSDENGRLTASAKNKVLEILGYKGFAGERDLGRLHAGRADEENLKMLKERCEVKKYDDHAVHIAEHTAYLLTEKLSAEAEDTICTHIDMHRNRIKENENERTDNDRTRG